MCYGPAAGSCSPGGACHQHLSTNHGMRDYWGFLHMATRQQAYSVGQEVLQTMGQGCHGAEDRGERPAGQSSKIPQIWELPLPPTCRFHVLVPLCGSRPLSGSGSVSQPKSTSRGLYQAEQGQDRKGDKPHPLHPVKRVPEEEERQCPQLCDNPAVSGMFQSCFAGLSSRSGDCERAIQQPQMRCGGTASTAGPCCLRWNSWSHCT